MKRVNCCLGVRVEMAQMRVGISGDGVEMGIETRVGMGVGMG